MFLVVRSLNSRSMVQFSVLTHLCDTILHVGHVYSSHAWYIATHLFYQASPCLPNSPCDPLWKNSIVLVTATDGDYLYKVCSEAGTTEWKWLETWAHRGRKWLDLSISQYMPTHSVALMHVTLWDKINFIYLLQSRIISMLPFMKNMHFFQGMVEKNTILHRCLIDW